MPSLPEDRTSYWSEHYAKQLTKTERVPPSQFAAFVASELSNDTKIVDVGCGNARDSLFFASYGFDVLGTDGSENAVKIATDKAAKMGLSNSAFQVFDVGETPLYEAISKFSKVKICVYARFFLHAITQNEQDFFLENLGKTLKFGDCVAFEYRTTEDEDIEKIASPHFRRYQNAENVNDALAQHGFKEIYTVHGKGFAKFQSEDAVVARCVFEKL